MIDEDARRPVLIVAGGARSLVSQAAALRTLTNALTDALRPPVPVRAVIGPGTLPGVGGALATAASTHGLTITAYLPLGATDVDPAARVHTVGHGDHGVLQPLTAWCDLLIQDPDAARSAVLLACSGGRITAAEVRLAALLGARVGWINLPGLPSLEAGCPEPPSAVTRLPPEGSAIREFLGWRSPTASTRE